MECIDVKQKFEAFCDGENQTGIQAHLDFCESCRNEFETLKSVSILLKKELPVSASSELDAKVLAAFKQHHKTVSPWNWSAIFGGIMISKPALAFGILAFLAFTSLAFFVGRMSATATQIVVSNPEPLKESPKAIEKSDPPKTVEVVKYVEVPTTKYVQVPVEKEKIVTKTIYRTIEKNQREKPLTQVARNTKTDAENSSNQLDLKDFQPIVEMKPRVLKKGEGNEK